MRNRTSDLRIPRSDALPLSHRDSTVSEESLWLSGWSIEAPATELPSPSLRKSDIIRHSIIFISSQVAPEILNQLPVNITRQTMEGNKYFVFTCTIVGNPSPLVYWTKNGLILNVTTNPRLSAPSGNSIYSLNIINVSRSDAGQYRCMAINSVGISTSLGETLKVFCEYFQI